MAKRCGNPGLKGRLIDKSIEAYVLSLETINSLFIKYRVETFSYLICNAWELLLKAKILDGTGDRGSIFYSEQPTRSLAVRDCVKRVYPAEKDPIRVNIEKVTDLRDEACHLVISKVPKNVLGLFQACVLNYHTALGLWFQESLSERVSVGMMTIVYDFAPQEFDMTNPRLRRQMGKETAQFLMRFQADIDQEFEKLGKPAEFAISIDYKLALTQTPGDADLLLSKGGGGVTTRLIEVPKDAARTHPFRQKDLVDATNRLLDGATKINSHDVQCVLKAYDVKKRPEFYYKSTIVGAPTQYSAEFAQWLSKQFTNNPKFFIKAREKAKTC